MNEYLINEVVFWLSLAFFSFMQFLPNYVLRYRTTHFLPLKFKRRGDISGIFSSGNQDVFRILIEVVLFGCVARLAGWADLRVLAVLYGVLFLFNTYHHVFRKIYSVFPNLYNDLPLVKIAGAIMLKESPAKLLLGLSGLVVAGLSLTAGFYQYLTFSRNLQTGTLFFVLSGILGTYFLTSIVYQFFFRTYKEMDSRIVLGSARIVVNLYQSLLLYLRLRRLSGSSFQGERKVDDFQLEKRPNLFFIFIESYGSYYFDRDHSRNYFPEFQAELSGAGWSMLSSMSRAPVSAGGSWLSYTTFFYGSRIDKQGMYERFLTDPELNTSDSLLRVLKRTGYTNYTLNPIKPNQKVPVRYEYLTPFYSVDKWILLDDMNYSGDTYGFGLHPPDQFSLNFALDYIHERGDDPFSLFFLTKNSHSPFPGPFELAEDWRELNQPGGRNHIGKGFLSVPDEKNYFIAIRYQLKNLHRFISERAQDDDIFFLIGDHQPPAIMDGEEEKFQTPVHVISKDRAFVDRFRDYGFDEIPSDKGGLSHESFHSIILRELIRNYGVKGTQLPEYLRDGIRF